MNTPYSVLCIFNRCHKHLFKSGGHYSEDPEVSSVIMWQWYLVSVSDALVLRSTSVIQDALGFAMAFLKWRKMSIHLQNHPGTKHSCL